MRDDGRGRFGLRGACRRDGLVDAAARGFVGPEQGIEAGAQVLEGGRLLRLVLGWRCGGGAPLEHVLLELGEPVHDPLQRLMHGFQRVLGPQVAGGLGRSQLGEITLELADLGRHCLVGLGQGVAGRLGRTLGRLLDGRSRAVLQLAHLLAQLAAHVGEEVGHRPLERGHALLDLLSVGRGRRGLGRIDPGGELADLPFQGIEPGGVHLGGAYLLDARRQCMDHAFDAREIGRGALQTLVEAIETGEDVADRHFRHWAQRLVDLARQGLQTRDDGLVGARPGGCRPPRRGRGAATRALLEPAAHGGEALSERRTVVEFALAAADLGNGRLEPTAGGLLLRDERAEGCRLTGRLSGLGHGLEPLPDIVERIAQHVRVLVPARDGGGSLVGGEVPLDLVEPPADGEQRLADGDGGLVLPLGHRARALLHLGFGALHPAGDGIERACRAGRGGACLGEAALADARDDLVEARHVAGAVVARRDGGLRVFAGKPFEARADFGERITLRRGRGSVALRCLVGDDVAEPCAERHSRLARRLLGCIPRLRVDALHTPGGGLCHGDPTALPQARPAQSCRWVKFC